MGTVFTAYPVLLLNRFFPDTKTVNRILFHQIILCPYKISNRYLQKSRCQIFFCCDKCNS